MYKSQMVLFVLVFFSILNIPAPAKDEPAAPRSGPANAEFKRVLQEWKTLVGELGALRAQYRTASKEERLVVKKQWDEQITKGKQMEALLFKASEKAFIEAPNADKQVTDLLLDIFNAEVAADDFENAARVGKLLVDNRCGDTKTTSNAGVAAVCVGDFETAEKFLGMAKEEGYYKKQQPNDKLADQAKYFSATLDELKKSWDKERQIREAESKADDLPRVLIKTNKGDIEVELFENEAPNTVANFITLVDKGFYNGLSFHRVLEHFMAQGGDPKGDGTGGPGYAIACECCKPPFRQHFWGSLSMANAGRDTGGSQFFITFLPTTHLDGKHTVFGRVTKGFIVLAKLQRRDPNDPNAPDPDKIIEAKVLRKRPHKYVVEKKD